jgi:hypothetical protein
MFEASSCDINTPSTTFRSACTCCLIKTAKLSYLLLNIECQVSLAQLCKLASEEAPWGKQRKISNVENFHTLAACSMFGGNIQELHHIWCATLGIKHQNFGLYKQSAVNSVFVTNPENRWMGEKKDKIYARLRHDFKGFFTKVILLINMFEAFLIGEMMYLRTRLHGVHPHKKTITKIL